MNFIFILFYDQVVMAQWLALQRATGEVFSEGRDENISENISKTDVDSVDRFYQ